MSNVTNILRSKIRKQLKRQGFTKITFAVVANKLVVEFVHNDWRAGQTYANVQFAASLVEAGATFFSINLSYFA